MQQDKTTLPSPMEIKTTLKEAGITQTAICDATGIPKGNLSAALSGRAYLGRARTLKIMDAMHALMAEIAANNAAVAAETNSGMPTFADASDTLESGKPDNAPRIRRL